MLPYALTLRSIVWADAAELRHREAESIGGLALAVAGHATGACVRGFGADGFRRWTWGHFCDIARWNVRRADVARECRGLEAESLVAHALAAAVFAVQA